MDKAMKVKITKLEFAWEEGIYAKLEPPDLEWRMKLIETEIVLPEDVLQEIQKDQDDEKDLIVCEFLIDLIGQQTNFPIKDLSWEEWVNIDE